MAQGKHVGKVVVAFSEAFVARRAEPLAPPFAVQQNGSYLDHWSIWRFRKGNRSVARRRRRPAPRPSEPKRRSQPRRRRALSKIYGRAGVDVRVVKADVELAFGRDATHGRNSRR